MPNSKGRRQEDAKAARAGKLPEKSKSFHGRASAASASASASGLRRPKTQPDLFSARTACSSASMSLVPQMTKILVNVTVKGAVGAMHVLASTELKVGELVAAALRQYEKEGRRPLLSSADPDGFDLHYSQFSLESLDRKVELITLGSRNFFLCPKPASGSGGSCSSEAGKASSSGVRWLRDLLLR